MNRAPLLAGQAPLEYRLALDAAMSVLAQAEAPRVICNVTALTEEVRQRILGQAESGPTTAALWVEPVVATYQSELIGLSHMLIPGAWLAIVASRPLARIIPERRGWDINPLGLRPQGLGLLRQALARSGLKVVANYGIHSASAMGLNLLGQGVERLGRPDLADRLNFAARLAYCTTGPLVSLATVALLIAQKGHA